MTTTAPTARQIIAAAKKAGYTVLTAGCKLNGSKAYRVAGYHCLWTATAIGRDLLGYQL